MSSSSDSSLATIAYLPLDNRPVHTDRALLLARSAGCSLLLPEESLYRTALDGQPENPKRSRHGDGNALLNWLEAVRADYYVLSVDQILSGGLVHSRHETEIGDAYERIDRLLSLLEGKKAILFDTVMRLAPTVGYQGTTAEDYHALRAYASRPRPSLTGELTVERVTEAYALPSELPEATLSAYHAARSRKLALADYLLSRISAEENVTVFYGIDDSVPYPSIQTNEIALLRQKCKAGHLFAGTDELGLMAVACTVKQYFASLPSPSIAVRYYGADPSLPADEYDSGSLGETVSAHIQALGLDIQADSPDIELLVFGASASDPESEAEQLLARYRENSKAHRPTLLVHLGQSDSLTRKLFSNPSLDLSFLLSYSSWNTAGNAVGIALANGLARYLYLKGNVSVGGADTAYLLLEMLVFAKEISYRAEKTEIDQMLLSHSADPSNFCGKVEKGEIEAFALRKMQHSNGEFSFKAISARLQGSRFLTSLAPMQTAEVPAFTLCLVSFPWYRTFEARLQIEIGAP